jgi:hypothetical protein
MLARPSGASFRVGLSLPTDECIADNYFVVFACDVLLACSCHDHVDVWSAAECVVSCCVFVNILFRLWLLVYTQEYQRDSMLP